MTLSQLLAAVGDENIEFQVLQTCLNGKQKAVKGGSNITFFAPGISLFDLVEDKPRKTGFVVWVPTAKLDAIRAQLKEKE